MNIDQLRTYCNSLPHVTEDIKWESDLCFCIGGKMFCVTGFSSPVHISIKVDDTIFEEFTQQDGIVPAPYLARYKWILIKDVSLLKRDTIEQLIFQSYQLIKNKLPKKIKDNLS